MRRLQRRTVITLAVSVGMIGVALGKSGANVDWPDFLSRHDLVWERAPEFWYEGPFLGNGMLGSMVYQVDDQTIRISLGRSDVEDHRKGGGFLKKARLPNGYFTLNTVGKISGFKGRLKLYDAEAVIRLQTEKGWIDIFNMVEGEDGKILLPPTRSPEYPGSGKDCNFNLSLFRWGCLTLIHIAERYRIDDPLLPKWKDVVKRLVDYPTDKHGFMVTAGIPFARAHRHYSHLLMIYPLGLINTEQPENRELIQKSVDHWTSFFKKGVTGYSYSGAAAMFALQGNGEKAAYYLDMFMRMKELFPDNPNSIHPTTMYTETVRLQPVTETPFSLCDSMQLMLLQSWGGTIRVFPALPDSWKNISFAGLLAAGGFEVSAVRKDDITQLVRIKSLAGEPCRLKTDLELERLQGIRKSAVKKGKDGTLEIDLKRGEEVFLYGQGVDPSVVIKPIDALLKNCNTFGLK